MRASDCLQSPLRGRPSRCTGGGGQLAHLVCRPGSAFGGCVDGSAEPITSRHTPFRLRNDAGEAVRLSEGAGQPQKAWLRNASTASSGSPRKSGVSATVTRRRPSSVENDHDWYARASPSLP